MHYLIILNYAHNVQYDPDQNHVISAMLSTLPSTIKAKQTKLAL